MVESAPRSARLRTGETGTNANTTECLGYGGGGNWRWRQLQQRPKLSKTEVGSPGRTRTYNPSVNRRRAWSRIGLAPKKWAGVRPVCRVRADLRVDNSVAFSFQPKALRAMENDL